MVRALPRWAHRPGITSEPDRAPLDAAKALVPDRYPEAGVPAADPAFRDGLVLHDGGFFWEAHEVWEAVWKASPRNGRDRVALRALIQVANAGLKTALGRRQAADRLVREALAELDELAMRSRGARSGGESIADALDAPALRAALAERRGPDVWLRLASCIKMPETGS